MTTYKPGEEWKQTLNENTFLKMRVEELQDENEALRLEIIEMRNTADQTDEILDEVIDSIEDSDGVNWFEGHICVVCDVEQEWNEEQLCYVHKTTGYRLCGVGHDPSGNEY